MGIIVYDRFRITAELALRIAIQSDPPAPPRPAETRSPEAKSAVPAITAQELMSIFQHDNLLVVDVRDPQELSDTGKIQGALNVSRGMLEFRADETTPYHDRAFSKDKTIILYCASGGRSALGAKALLDLGYQNVRNLGAFKGWVEAGGAVDPV